MTIAAEFDVLVGRSAGAVFDELTAVERYPEWLRASGVTAVERELPAPLEPGSRFRMEQRIAGRATVLDATVLALEPGRRFAFRAIDQEGISIDVDALLAPDGPMTRLRWSLRLGLPLRYRLFESMAAPQVRQAAASDVDAFRQRLEAVA